MIMLFAIPGLALWQVARSRRAFGSPAERATLDVLEQANRLAPPFRQGLTRSAAEKTVAGLL
ncbi:MAG: sensor histidine kinase, partial [Actinobacteria bacterium]|nr:sensor histidine kinase [Actinomycetota bacterium]